MVHIWQTSEPLNWLTLISEPVDSIGPSLMVSGSAGCRRTGNLIEVSIYNSQLLALFISKYFLNVPTSCCPFSSIIS